MKLYAYSKKVDHLSGAKARLMQLKNMNKKGIKRNIHPQFKLDTDREEVIRNL